ncbi:hypothetical protein TNCV_3273851 [Trichonephila clavipes]|nr:hypothetical protein TNCV_3273851 [Trichonephila clavipes]
MTILLSDDIPVSQRSRRLPFVEQKIVENQIQEWLNANIIKPSCSDYATPIVLCKKKNGEHRLCVDYRNLNRKMIKDKFPLPLIEEVLDKLENSKVYTSLDLKNGFFHVPMDPNSTKYTSFVTHEGQYELLRVPFGLSNTPSVFQRYIYTVFRKLIRDNILIVYMDDLLIPSQNEAEENPVLHVFQQGYPLELQTDASSLSFGAVLLQKSDDGLFHPIHYFSRKTAVHQEKYSSYELEVLAIIEALKKFRSYLLDKGSAFTSTEFQTFCQDESIEHIQITAGVPRGSGQIDHMHETIIPVLTKLTIEEPEKWFKHVHRLQRIMNSTTTRSTKFTPFEVLIGVKMKQKRTLKLKIFLKTNLANSLLTNERHYFGTGLKLRPKYFGPYEVTKVNKHDRYEVQKIGQHEGPNVTSTSADKMNNSLVPRAPRMAWSSGCPCGRQLLADHLQSQERTEVTRCSQPRLPDSSLPAADLLNCCHSAYNIGSDAFQLKPHGRRCLGTHCVFPDALSSPDGEQTKHIVDTSLVTPRTKFQKSFPGINDKTGISATLAARARCPQ